MPGQQDPRSFMQRIIDTFTLGDVQKRMGGQQPQPPGAPPTPMSPEAEMGMRSSGFGQDVNLPVESPTARAVAILKQTGQPVTPETVARMEQMLAQRVGGAARQSTLQQSLGGGS